MIENRATLIAEKLLNFFGMVVLFLVLVYSMHTQIVPPQMLSLFELGVTAFTSMSSNIRMGIFLMILQTYIRDECFVTS